MAQQASDDWLTTTLQRSGFYFHPLGMGCRHVVRESTDLPLYVIHQPADTILWRMAINKWAVLVWHDATLAKAEACWRLMPPRQVIPLHSAISTMPELCLDYLFRHMPIFSK